MQVMARRRVVGRRDRETDFYMFYRAILESLSWLSNLTKETDVWFRGFVLDLRQGHRSYRFS